MRTWTIPADERVGVDKCGGKYHASFYAWFSLQYYGLQQYIVAYNVIMYNYTVIIHMWGKKNKQMRHFKEAVQ